MTIPKTFTVLTAVALCFAIVTGYSGRLKAEESGDANGAPSVAKIVHDSNNAAYYSGEDA